MTLDKDDKQRKPHPWLPVIIAATGVAIATLSLLAATDSGPFTPSPPPDFTADLDNAQAEQLSQLNSFLQTGKETADIVQLHLNATIDQKAQAVAVSVDPLEDGTIEQLSLKTACAMAPKPDSPPCNYELILIFTPDGPDYGYASHTGPTVRINGYFRVTGEQQKMGLSIFTLLQVAKPWTRAERSEKAQS
jgi:hypothetical protein